MNIKALQKEYIQSLSRFYDADEAKAIFNLSVTSVLKVNQSELLLPTDKELDTKDLDKLNKVLKELSTGKPIQQILGETIFYKLPFKITADVLIPRPETEELVDWIITELKDKNKSLLDVGTGSGCIPITLKKNLPQLDVSALDVSANALSIARANASLNKVEVNFIEADILNYTSDIKYDVIVSNPPYIRELEKADMHENVLAHEPHLALFVSDENPLIFYDAISDFALKNLNPNGYLFFEINEYLWVETLQILMDKRFKNIELRKDMQGKDRMVLARTNP
ncbi:peptide chain release factor N(5)-glutamine methyltransferase [Pedobacter jejuensis]|uniref:peptide chain release factor N(5)-glutamine methyltransferase n=1 Tax=Pedobacter jejuensis TaxID=1268550 RepID=A0A3N0BTC9_9SPHI|nr:peptide chain release factor N(5)-glutamine methyltransferase [Pedobacter jejuensis]RNL52357.1 peptide chain release factor N(5)-glutamine methyltransferase [Pedobacter jejuensis]